MHWHDIPRCLQYDNRSTILGVAGQSACRRQPDIRCNVQPCTFARWLPCLGTQVSREKTEESCSYAQSSVHDSSMLVDPTGKVQTELDEKEGIAFGEIGKGQSCGQRVSRVSRISI